VKPYHVFVQGLSEPKKKLPNGGPQRLYIDEFIENQWSEGYYYQTKFTDSIKAFGPMKRLDTHSLNHRLVEYLFDANNRELGPRIIEIYPQAKQDFNDYLEKTIELFNESTSEIRNSRPHKLKEFDQKTIKKAIIIDKRSKEK
jgi:hypothetical protein